MEYIDKRVVKINDKNKSGLVDWYFNCLLIKVFYIEFWWWVRIGNWNVLFFGGFLIMF